MSWRQPMVLRLIVIILYRDVYVKSMTIIIIVYILIILIVFHLYLFYRFLRFPECVFATIYNNM